MKFPCPAIIPLTLAALVLDLVVACPTRAQSWATNSPLQTARWEHTATVLNNGTVLIAGGTIYNVGGFQDLTNGCELYDPLAGTSVATVPMQYSRHQHRATRLPNGQILISGGAGASSELYDPNSGSWVNFAAMEDERLVHVATLLPDGKVLAAGGYDDSTGQELASAELYDPASGTWTNTVPMPYAADTLAGVLLTNGLVLVCGGYDGSQSVTNAVLYNPVSQTWTNTGPLNEGRSGHTATLLPDGTVLVVGGGDNTAEVYDPVARTWTYAANMNDGRRYIQTVLLNNGQVLALGDGNAHAELYDRRNDEWFYTASEVIPGNFQTATLLPDGRVVVTGGSISQYNGPAMATVQTYVATAPEVGHILIAHYPFDTSSTDPNDAQFLADTSGNGNNLSNPSSLGGSLPAVTTDSEAGTSAVQFDGNGYFVLPRTLLTTIAGTYSLSLWLKTSQGPSSDPTEGPSDPALVWAGGISANYNDSEPMTLTGNQLGFYTGDDERTLNSVTAINSGNFTHLVITRDQPTGMKKIYINGMLDATATGGTAFLDDSSDLVLGVSYYQGGVAGIVDDVQFYNGLLTADDVASLYANPGATVPDIAFLTLTLALNATNLDWTSSGDAQWFGQNDTSHDGHHAAQSGSLLDNQSSTLQTTVTGPGTLTFWWQTTGAGDGFYVAFAEDGIVTASLPSPQPWTQQTFQLSAGSHTLTWAASSPSGSTPGDAAYLDQVNFTVTPPHPAPGVGPLGWWKGDGNALDSAGTANGILHDSVTYAPGVLGSAFNFDGSGGFVELPPVSASLPEGTISLWTYLRDWNWQAASAGIYLWAGTLYLPSAGSFDGINLGNHSGYTSTGELLFGIFNGGWQWAHSGLVPKLNTWYHVAGTWGAGGVQIFVNGEFKGSNPFTGPAPDYTMYNLIGRSSWASSEINGLVDDVRLYGRALTAPQIEALAHPISNPALAITTQGANVIISWPAGANSFNLESTPSLSRPSWTAVTNLITWGDASFTLTNAATGPGLFYRLKQ